MSRYSDGDYDDEDFPGQAGLWRANADRALKGKRGRKALSDLREALLNLPEKRLISGALCTVDPAPRHRAFTSPSGYRVGQYADMELDETVAEQGEGVCAIGAYLWWRKVKGGADPVEAFNQLPTLVSEDGGLGETAALAKREAGMVYSLAWDLAYRNDETFDNATPEVRYGLFMEWLDKELGVVPVSEGNTK